jgi:hypothetical protein
VNVDPTPSSLRTTMSPPIARARSRLIERPSPTPSSDDTAPLTCTNGSNTFSRCASASPMPVSVTCTTTVPASTPASHVTVTCPPSGVNFTALLSRLRRICRSFTALARANRSGAFDANVKVSPFSRICGITSDSTAAHTSATGTSSMSDVAIARSSFA